jgi:predicted nucleic acid-binding protein
MSVRVMIDTNILVYAYDRSEPAKQEAAVRVLDRLVRLGSGVISPQVLGEFFLAATKKIPAPLTREEAAGRIRRFCQLWPVLELNEMVAWETVRGVLAHRFSYWDAQIWACARMHQAGMVFSEDFHQGTVDGVRFVNPLTPDFDVDSVFSPV